MRPLSKRLLATLAIVAAATAAAASPAAASSTQQSIIQDDSQLHANLNGTLATMVALGASTVRVAVYWNTLAPQPRSTHAPKHFNGADPAAYPAASWTFYDNVVRQATADGLTVDLDPTGPAPLWAAGGGMPRAKNCPCGQWKPNAPAFGLFAQALGRRYGGSYTPAGATSSLPAVRFWSVWNEPNYGPDLAPQATGNNTVDEAAILYRALLGAAWKGLGASGHSTRSDTILIGETAPRGESGPGFPGNFSGTKPMRFLRALYCVGTSLRPLRGNAASSQGCPTSSSGSRAFRTANPALFSASGYAAHPYAQGVAPNKPTFACGLSACTNAAGKSDPDYADFPELGRLEQALDRMNRAYGSHTHYSIWNTEYGYWTNPPDPNATISPQTAAYYMNWAEYLSYRQPRLLSYCQYLLVDPPGGNFASGLELSSGVPKATLAGFQLPLYLPVRTAGGAASLEVWGDARPARLSLASPQVQIQFAPGTSSAFQTVQTVPISTARGYFDVHQAFTQSGSVRLAFQTAAGTVYSRTQAITIR